MAAPYAPKWRLSIHTHTRSLIDFRRCFEGGTHHIKNNTDAEGRTPCQEQKALYAPKSKQFHTKFVSHTGETQEHMIQSLTPRYSQRCIYSDWLHFNPSKPLTHCISVLVVFNSYGRTCKHEGILSTVPSTSAASAAKENMKNTTTAPHAQAVTI